MSASTAPAVKAKLVTLFAAAVEEATQVWFNHTNEDHQIAENVYVCGIRGERQWSGLGRHRANQVEENYSVEVDVEVYRDGTDAEGTENRMWAIVALLEAAIEDPTLGNQQGVTWSLVEHFDQKSTGGNDGWMAAITLGVAVKARI
jgi:hypothetical protein